jgi:DnaK suppressor protein
VQAKSEKSGKSEKAKQAAGKPAAAAGKVAKPGKFAKVGAGKPVIKAVIKTVVKTAAKTSAKTAGKVAVKPKGQVKVKANAKVKASRRAAVKPVAKKVAKPVVKKTAPKPVAKASPAKAKKPPKAAVKTTTKAPAKAAAKPLAKASARPVVKPVPKVAAQSVAKPPLKPASKSIAKPVPKTVITPVKSKSKPMSAAASQKTGSLVPPVAMPAAPVRPVPSNNGLPPPPPLKPGRRSSSRALAHMPPPAPMVPTHAPDAAKASYSTMTERVIAPPPHVAAKKDPKLANNWKTKAAETLTDDEVKAMPDTEYMNDNQMAFFRYKLSILKQDIHNSAGATTEHLREDTAVVPDPADRATIEEEHALELRTRDRERKLLKKIEQSIARIDSGDYGYCDETGEPIGVGRLIARPTASLSLEAQQRRELKQKMFGD